FPGAFTVKAGATLGVADSLNVLIRGTQTITIDSGGMLNVGADAVAIEDPNNFSQTEGIVVNGSMTAAGASFTRAGGTNGNNNSQILVNAGGHFLASNCTFDWDNIVLANGVVFNNGDVTGNIFGLTAASTTLSLPGSDVPLLTNNKSFQDVAINAGSL